MTELIETYINETTPSRIMQRYRSLVQFAESADFGTFDEDIVVIDTETTGVSFSHDELTQIAAARMVRGQITEWFVTFVNPGKPIPEDIAHLTNITNEDVADAVTPEQALADLVNFVGDSMLLAHNAEFDKAFCTKHAEGAPLEENLWLDSLDLARIALPRLKSHRLIDIVSAFNVPPTVAHRADADVETLCSIYRILLAAVANMPAALVANIANMAPPEEWPTVVVFQHFADPNAEEFSLRRLRQSFVDALPASRRVDAADLAADPARGLSFPTSETIEAAFQAEGIAGAMYEAFEPRSEQVEMAKLVNNAFAKSENLVVEAGTGVGKSLAYLVPSALIAKENNICMGVATKTNALLDQLVHHELPLLAEALGGLEFASLKGFSHYPCLRSIERVAEAGPKIVNVQGKDVSQAPSLAGLLSFIEQSDYDDIDSLKIDFRALPRRAVTTNSNDCLRRKCPFFGTKCFVHGARAKAESADIVVTNQSLLFCDVAAEGGLLPPVRYWVIDEAHSAEDEARRAFSVAIDAAEIRAVATRASSVEPSRNMFTRAERQIVGKAQATEAEARAILGDAEYEEEAKAGHSEGDTLAFALCAKARSAGSAFAQAAEEFCTHIHDLLFFEEQGNGRSYDHVDLWINEDVRSSYSFGNLASLARVMCDASERLIGACQSLVSLMEGIPGVAAAQREIASAALYLKDLLSACEIILFSGPPTYAYAAHLVRKGQGSESLEALLLSVGDRMNETLFANTHSVVFTSATITVAESFENFTNALGLGQTEYSTTATAQLDSSYDFDRNMTIYVASDLPEPNNASYLKALEQLLIGVHRAQGGSVLTLFTNRREMEKSYDAVRAALTGEDLRIVCQKWGVSTKGLRDEFLADETLSLFALKSFWEGFDAPGATLKTVVIPKLPFAKPTDPLSCERGKCDPQAWAHYVLPAAVLETKQAAGRLIRSSTDKGSLVLADVRLVTKGYGKTFLRSLPSSNIKVLTTAEIIEELARTNAPATPAAPTAVQNPSKEA